MSVFPEFEQALRAEAERRFAPASHPARPRRMRLAGARWRVPLLAAFAVLATGVIALAATGVVLTGTPVHPEELANPNAGLGITVHGGSSGIVATAPDPEGGLPWGMRIVQTTRGETCLQIGRVQNGQLGVLGIDGAFANDGRFHPIPTSALPKDVYHHTFFDQLIGNATISCALNGKAVAGEHIGIDRNADPRALGHGSRAQLRDVLYGLLGPQAASVTYHFEHASHTISVAGTTGAYLVVHGYAPREQAASGQEALGTPGDLAAGGELSLITYRIGGALCNRGPTLAPRVVSHLAKPCPFPHFPQAAPEPALHLPLQVRLATHGDRVTGLSVSMRAPFAVTGASQHYTLELPTHTCRAPSGFHGGGLETIARNVAPGERISWAVPKPVASGCNLQTLAIEVNYSRGEGLGRTIASATIHAPHGTAFAAPLTPPLLRQHTKARAPG